MSSSLNVRWLIEAGARIGRPLALARARASSGAAALIWSTSRRAPVRATRAMSRSSMIVSAAPGSAGQAPAAGNLALGGDGAGGEPGVNRPVGDQHPQAAGIGQQPAHDPGIDDR